MSIFIAKWVVLLLVIFIFLMYRTGSAQEVGGEGRLPSFVNGRYRENLIIVPVIVTVQMQ